MDAANIGATAAAIVMGAWGVWSQKKAATAHAVAHHAQTRVEEVQKRVDKLSSEDLAERNAEIALAHKQKAEEWKTLYTQEHDESQRYRTYVHEKAKTDNSTLLNLTEENAMLKARTDLGPVLEYIKESAETNRQVAGTLNTVAASQATLTDAVRALVDRLDKHQFMPGESRHEH